MAKGSRTRTAQVPANETKVDAFKRLATKRTNKALKAIRAIGQLSTGNYEYTGDQYNKIFGAIEAEAKKAFARFANPQVKSNEPEFTV